MKKLIAILFVIMICLAMSISVFAIGIGMQNDEKLINGVIPENPISIAEQIQKVRSNDNYSNEKKNRLYPKFWRKVVRIRIQELNQYQTRRKLH